MVSKALKSSHLTQGKLVQKFEETCAEYLNKPYAVAVSNGTAALYCAYRTYYERTFEEREVLEIPAITFKATLRALLLTENKYRVVDTEEDGMCRKASVKIDLGGAVPDYKCIIEDASHAFGSLGVGNSLMTCFSLHATKNLGVGEGGLIVTDSKEMYEGLKSIREFGTVSHPSLNFRMSEVPAALGLSRIKRVNEDAGKKLRLMFRYVDKGIPIIPYLTNPSINPHLAICKFNNPVKIHWGLKKEGIGSQKHYEPLEKGYILAPHPFASYYWRTSLSIPLYPQLTIQEQDKVIQVLHKLMKEDKNGKD